MMKKVHVGYKQTCLLVKPDWTWINGKWDNFHAKHVVYNFLRSIDAFSVYASQEDTELRLTLQERLIIGRLMRQDKRIGWGVIKLKKFV